ncbi:MAG: M48 family metallopeptidase [Actinobacteria bacterium]|nr:M48 family metallopeptidase [Actinomycetota bacterium]
MSKQQPRVEVRLSARRRKTATAFWQGGQIVVVVPARASRAARDQLVDDLVRKVRNRRPMLSASDKELTLRARQLADAYIPQAQPSSVRWVGNQHHQWGSCTPLTGEIRISERLRPVPAWVLDGVLVHELAHLIEPTHSATFRALVGLYPRAKEVDAFLAGLALGLDLVVDGVQ